MLVKIILSFCLIEEDGKRHESEVDHLRCGNVQQVIEDEINPIGQKKKRTSVNDTCVKERIGDIHTHVTRKKRTKGKYPASANTHSPRALIRDAIPSSKFLGIASNGFRALISNDKTGWYFIKDVNIEDIQQWFCSYYSSFKYVSEYLLRTFSFVLTKRTVMKRNHVLYFSYKWLS